MLEDIRNVLVIIATVIGIYKLLLDIAVLKKAERKKKRPSRKRKGRKKKK